MLDKIKCLDKDDIIKTQMSEFRDNNSLIWANNQIFI